MEERSRQNKSSQFVGGALLLHNFLGGVAMAIMYAPIIKRDVWIVYVIYVYIFLVSPQRVIIFDNREVG